MRLRLAPSRVPAPPRDRIFSLWSADGASVPYRPWQGGDRLERPRRGGQDSIDPDVENYDATGTVDATVMAVYCDTALVSLPIIDGMLTFYTSANVAFANQHQFTIIAEEDATMSCGELASSSWSFVRDPP